MNVLEEPPNVSEQPLKELLKKIDWNTLPRDDNPEGEEAVAALANYVEASQLNRKFENYITNQEDTIKRYKTYQESIQPASDARRDYAKAFANLGIDDALRNRLVEAISAADAREHELARRVAMDEKKFEEKLQVTIDLYEDQLRTAKEAFEENQTKMKLLEEKAKNYEDKYVDLKGRYANNKRELDENYQRSKRELENKFKKELLDKESSQRQSYQLQLNELERVYNERLERITQESKALVEDMNLQRNTVLEMMESTQSDINDVTRKLEETLEELERQKSVKDSEIEEAVKRIVEERDELVEEHESLVRMLEKQIEQLTMERDEVAEAHDELEDKINMIKSGVYTEIKRYHDFIGDLKQSIENERQKNAAITKDLSQARQRQDASRAEAKYFIERYNDTKKELKEVRDTLIKYIALQDVKSREASIATSDYRGIAKRLEVANDRIKILENIDKDQRIELDSLREEKQRLLDGMRKAARQVADTDLELKELRTEYEELERANAGLQTKIRDLAIHNKGYADTLKRLKVENAGLKQSKEDLAVRLIALQNAPRPQTVDVDAIKAPLQNTIEELEDALQDRKDKLTRMAKLYDDNQKRLELATNQIASLEDTRRGLEHTIEKLMVQANNGGYLHAITSISRKATHDKKFKTSVDKWPALAAKKETITGFFKFSSSQLEMDDFVNPKKRTYTTGTIYQEINLVDLPPSIASDEDNLEVYDDSRYLRQMLDYLHKPQYKLCIPIWTEGGVLQPRRYVKVTDHEGDLVSSPHIEADGTIFVHVPEFGDLKAIINYDARRQVDKLPDNSSTWIISKIQKITSDAPEELSTIATLMVKMYKYAGSDSLKVERMILCLC